MVAHSGVLAWRIPGTEEPGGLPSMGSKSRTQLKQLSSSNSHCSKSLLEHHPLNEGATTLQTTLSLPNPIFLIPHPFSFIYDTIHL